jgi:hypothetical protein
MSEKTLQILQAQLGCQVEISGSIHRRFVGRFSGLPVRKEESLAGREPASRGK